MRGTRYADALVERWSHRLSFLAGMWSLTELTMDTVAGGGLRIYSLAVVPTPVLVVAAGADLRPVEPGAANTVTKVGP